MKKTETIVWDVDTQNDFILPDGALSVPGAHNIVETFGAALKHFDKKEIPILGSVDAHIDYELIPGTMSEHFPLHCVKGTSGQEKVGPTQYADILYVSDQKYNTECLDKIIKEVKNGRRVYIEKQRVSFTSNPNTNYLIKKLGVKEVYLMGVATNICVKAAYDAFKDMGMEMCLVTDAMKGLDLPGNTEKDALKEMINSGAEIYKI